EPDATLCDSSCSKILIGIVLFVERLNWCILKLSSSWYLFISIVCDSMSIDVYDFAVVAIELLSFLATSEIFPFDCLIIYSPHKRLRSCAVIFFTPLNKGDRCIVELLAFPHNRITCLFSLIVTNRKLSEFLFTSSKPSNHCLNFRYLTTSLFNWLEDVKSTFLPARCLCFLANTL